jgi:plastocyanin
MRELVLPVFPALFFWGALFVSAAPLSAAPLVAGTVQLTGSRAPQVQKGKDYSGVVVWLEGENVRPVPRRADMLQKNKEFVPHVLAVAVGSPVAFPNLDPIFHNAFSSFSGQIFDVGLYAPGTSRTVVFRRSGVVRVFCNIHPAMSAVIAVVPTPHYAVSNKNGSFEIPDVAPGDYQLRVFHDRATEETLEKLERRITVGEDKLILPPISVSESGYIQLPHKNKYGKEYPAEGEDHVVYPGARR